MVAAAAPGRTRHLRTAPCPVCGGHAGLPQGSGVRCAGFTLDTVAFCTREEYAGGLPIELRTEPPSYKHRLLGRCGCGRTHGWEAALEEALREMAELRLALASISVRYFEGRDVLYADMGEAIANIGDGLAALADLYNGWPGQDRERYNHGRGSEEARSVTFLIDASSMDEEAREGAAALISYLVDMAKAEAVDMMGDRREAVALARRHLGFTS